MATRTIGVVARRIVMPHHVVDGHAAAAGMGQHTPYGRNSGRGTLDTQYAARAYEIVLHIDNQQCCIAEFFHIGCKNTNRGTEFKNKA